MKTHKNHYSETRAQRRSRADLELKKKKNLATKKSFVSKLYSWMTPIHIAVAIGTLISVPFPEYHTPFIYINAGGFIFQLAVGLLLRREQNSRISNVLSR